MYVRGAPLHHKSRTWGLAILIMGFPFSKIRPLMVCSPDGKNWEIIWRLLAGRSQYVHLFSRKFGPGIQDWRGQNFFSWNKQMVPTRRLWGHILVAPKNKSSKRGARRRFSLKVGHKMRLRKFASFKRFLSAFFQKSAGTQREINGGSGLYT